MNPICLSIKQEETGKRIKQLLQDHGYKVKDIQGAMGFETPQVVYKWLSGKSLPSLDNLNDLEAGKVDLLGPLLKNEYTEEIYNFPEQDYGTVYTTLSVHWKPEICVRITLLLLCR